MYVPLGDVPRGFVETNESPCKGAAFVRGILVTKSAEDEWDQANGKFSYLRAVTEFPRWVLYGGPLGANYAENFNSQMWQWAIKNGYDWLMLPTACVMPAWEHPWPADASWHWDWVWEPGEPKVVTRWVDPGMRYAQR
jgi:hypothetical protein